MTVERTSNQCVTCDGTGQVGIPGGPCPMCRGSGTLLAPNYAHLPLRDRVLMACCAGCNCPGLGTKTPEPSAHDPICRYRVMMECLEILDDPPDETNDELLSIEAILTAVQQLVFSVRRRFYDNLDSYCWRVAHNSDGKFKIAWPDALGHITLAQWNEAFRSVTAASPVLQHAFEADPIDDGICGRCGFTRASHIDAPKAGVP